MDIEQIIYKKRTIRRFNQEPIPIDILKKLIDFARMAPMGNNIQSLEYIIIIDNKVREKLFPLVAWAGSLPKDERVPEENRRPMGYIIVLVNTKIKKEPTSEIGAAIENILLGAVSYGLGACWMGSIDRKQIRELLDISNEYEISYVISIGYPDEESVVEPYIDSMKYWKDKDERMHVPKRSLENILLKII